MFHHGRAARAPLFQRHPHRRRDDLDQISIVHRGRFKVPGKVRLAILFVGVTTLQGCLRRRTAKWGQECPHSSRCEPLVDSRKFPPCSRSDCLGFFIRCGESSNNCSAKMKIACCILLIVPSILLASCSRSGEAKTRKEQEAEFASAFGFSPPPTITTINYSDLSNRGVMDGAYGLWLSFSFDQASFDKIVLGGFKKGQMSVDPTDSGSGSPAWWPKTVAPGTVIFSRSQDDTPANEGFQFREYLWHDSASGLVFFHKSYWD
jgi:hypothetical protein